MQKSNKTKNIRIEDYIDIIETVARIEHSRLFSSSHLLEFSELINIGATAVYVILSSYPENYHNNSYIFTAIKWAIRNELRKRYRWYSHKHSSKKQDSSECLKMNKNQVREAVYETILSIDELAQSENPLQLEDNSLNPEQKIELFELKKAIGEAINYLSKREKDILDAKFFKNKKIKEIAAELDVSPSRISKIIQSALDKLKAELVSKGII